MLHRTWVTPLVVAFWCVTSGWLIVAKILPTFHAGSAPNQAHLVAAGTRLVPAGWTVHWKGIPIGWALTESHRSADGGITVANRLHCDQLPLDEMLSGWAGSLVKRTLRGRTSTMLDAAGRVVFDSGGRLRSFASTVTLPGTTEKIVLEGRVAGRGEVTIEFRAGELRYETTRTVPDQVLMGDELSPQATLPGLYEGRRWTLPVYSPLRPGHAPLQFLHASVGGEETIFWDNRLVIARVVTYREDPSSSREPRCRLWVDRSGRVLRHEAAFLGGTMEFVRRSDAEAERLVAVGALIDAVPQPATASPTRASP